MKSIVNTYGFFYLIFIFALSLIFLKSTQSYFTDSAASTNNTFTAASSFPTPTPTIVPSSTPVPTPGPGDVVINEVWPHGNADAEWVELFNKANFSINITGWKITDKDNTGSPDILPTIPSIPPGGYLVFVGGGTSTVNVPISAIKVQLSGTIGGALNSENDGFSLMKPDNSVIDGVSWGNNTIFMSPSVTPPVNNRSLARQPNGIDTNVAADWTNNATHSIGVANP